MPRTAGQEKQAYNIELGMTSMEEVGRLESFIEAESLSEVIRRSVQEFDKLLGHSSEPVIQKLIDQEKRLPPPSNDGAVRTNTTLTSGTKRHLATIREALNTTSDKESIARIVRFFAGLLPQDGKSGPLLNLRIAEGRSVVLFI